MEVAGECDRALLARAQANVPFVYSRLWELARMPGLERSELGRIAERVIRLLDNPRGVYLAYYPAAPELPFRGVALGYCFSFELAPRRGGPPRRLTYIVLFQPCKVVSDPELRYVLAHELAHAAGCEDEAWAGTLADVLAIHFPAWFAQPAGSASLLEPWARFVDAGDVQALARERPREFHEILARCRAELKPVR